MEESTYSNEREEPKIRQNSETDEQTKISNGASFSIGIAIVATLLYVCFQTSYFQLILLLVIVVSVVSVILYYFMTAPTDTHIIRKLNKMGYECGMDEGRICFKRKDSNWNIFTYNIKRRYRRVTFGIGFTDSNLDKDHALTNRMFCIVASRNRHVTLTWNGTDTYVCEFHTVLTSTRDIEREFKTAMSVIDETLGDLYTLFSRAFSQQPTEMEHKIGFRTGGGDSAPEEYPTEIRAQKETETTN